MATVVDLEEGSKLFSFDLEERDWRKYEKKIFLGKENLRSNTS